METGTARRIGKNGRASRELIDLYEHYSPRLFRYAYRLLNDADLAEECVAETFSRFLHSIRQSGTHPANVQAYLYRAAHNWIIDLYRHRTPLTLDPRAPADGRANPAVAVAEELESSRVRTALFQLSEEQRQVIVLRFLEEMPHEQVAAALGKSVEATRALQYRAITALRGLLSEQED